MDVRDLTITSSHAVDKAKFREFGLGPTFQTSHRTIHDAFSAKAEMFASIVAVEHGLGKLTYGELEKLTDRLAGNLIARGLQPRAPVVLVVRRSIPMIIAILAILKSGCQYVPLDGGVVSDAALAHVVAETRPPFLLCLEVFTERVNKHVAKSTSILCIEKLLDSEQPYNDDPMPRREVNSEDSAYTIYTSGSTGKPKGVEVSHGNVTNLLGCAPGNLGVQPGRRVGQLLSVAFDMAVWEILGTLMNGGTLCIRGSDWDETLLKIDTIIATPTILGSLDEQRYPNIRTIAVAGEPCPSILADRWAVNRDFFNCCGPTEVTIVNTMQKHAPGQALSIGRPVPNTTVYILNESEEPAQIGHIGVMWVGGAGVSKGYVNLSSLTESRYKPDKFLSNGSKMFNTGDLCRWRVDGTVEPLGRIDDQVKVKGFRVELDGVAAVVQSQPEVSRACALLVNGALICYYTAPQPIEHEMLDAFSRKTLPYYALPASWKWLPELPVSPNGKIDKAALKSFPWPSASSSVSLVELPKTEKDLASSQVSSKESIDEKHHVTSTCEKLQVLPNNQEYPPGDGFVLPPAKGTHSHMWLRYYFFTMYRRLFSVVFIGNLAAILTIFGYRGTLDKLRLSDLATATAANVTTALLMRQDYVINLLFTVACSAPTCLPLFIRRNCAKIFHIGGIHASAGVAAVFWFLILTVAATIGVAAPGKSSLGKTDPAIVVIAYLILALAISILATAYPTFRAQRHNAFEMIHRFAGWTVLLLFWVLTILSADAARKSSSPRASLPKTLAKDPTLYLLSASTLSVALPWLRLRKVTVNPEPLSSHAIRLHFTYADTIPGTAVRISERPLLEWHAFATVAKPGVRGFSLVVSNAGDWTKRQIGRAPTKLWVRGIPACGVLRIAPLFRRIVLVATGSGIGPCLPVLLAKKIPMRVFWSAPNHKQTFGEEILQAVAEADPRAVVWNTRERGKPDMVSEVYRLVAEEGKDASGSWHVEAVCVIANKKVTELVVRGMESRGIAAFGAIFDS